MTAELLDREPAIKERIDRVGVWGVRTYIKVNEFPEPLLASVDVAIDLPADKRGVHLSRLVDAVISSASESRPSLEGYAEAVLQRLKHSCLKAEVGIRTTIMLPRRLPASERVVSEPYDVLLRLTRQGDLFSKYVEVSVIGSTACPHCLEVTGCQTHIQRTLLKLGILTEVDADIRLADLIEACEKSLSSPTYSLLKTDDEAMLVEKMYENPRLVEDAARECLEHVRALGVKGRVKIRVISQESVHKHDVISEIERELP